MSDWWNQPTQPAPEPGAPAAEVPSTCPWCAQPATPDGSYCSSCGAALTQHEDLGGLVIPGVTAVDPGMQSGAYTSSLIKAQSRASTLSMVRAVAGPTAQIVVAASMLAKDGLSGTGGSVDPEAVGKPSQAALEMASRLRSGGAPVGTPPDQPAGPAGDGLAESAPTEATTGPETAAPAAAAPTHDPWFDLPPAAPDPSAGAQLDPRPSGAGAFAGGPSIDPANDPWATAPTPWTDDSDVTEPDSSMASPSDDHSETRRS
ncbi:MAG: hypothetical protein ABSB75_03530 [Candidatus Limnocylindrales bacterium]